MELSVEGHHFLCCAIWSEERELYALAFQSYFHSYCAILDLEFPNQFSIWQAKKTEAIEKYGNIIATHSGSCAESSIPKNHYFKSEATKRNQQTKNEHVEGSAQIR